MIRSIITKIGISQVIIISLILTITCLATAFSPSPALSQTSTPPTTATLPAILSISLEFVAASSPPSPTASSTPASSYFDINVRTQVTGINLVDKIGQAIAAGEGHLMYYSGAEPAVVPTWPAYTYGNTYTASTSTLTTWVNALPAYSVYGVEIVNNDNTALNPPVYAMIRTNKQPLSATPPRPMITSFSLSTNPPSSPRPSPGHGTRVDTVLSTRSANFNIVNKINSQASSGEGHYIFYSTVDPLITAPGQSAFIGGNYSFASTSGGFTWLNELTGYNTYSVQLVNNDDTPLDLPVFALIKTNIYSNMKTVTPPASNTTNFAPSSSVSPASTLPALTPSFGGGTSSGGR
jgi:hypothetical protein